MKLKLNEFPLLLGFYSDGFDPWDRSSYSMWPLLFAVYNFSLSDRLRKLLFAGLTQGPDKPKSMRAYQREVFNEIIDSEAFDGLEVTDLQGSCGGDYPGSSLIAFPICGKI